MIACRHVEDEGFNVLHLQQTFEPVKGRGRPTARSKALRTMTGARDADRLMPSAWRNALIRREEILNWRCRRYLYDIYVLFLVLHYTNYYLYINVMYRLQNQAWEEPHGCMVKEVSRSAHVKSF